MSDTDLLRRLATIRTAVRVRLVLYGLFAAVAGGLVAGSGLVFLDWWLWLPSVLRLALSVLFVGGCVGMIARWIAHPLRAKLDLDELAGRLERHFPALGDSLTSTVSFVGASAPRTGESPELIRQVVRTTTATVENVPLEQALTHQPLIRCLSFAVMCLVCVAMIAWASPGWYRTGLVRYARPFHAVEWPRTFEINALPCADKVALGGALPVRMRVARGMNDNLRAIVHVRDIHGSVSSFAMQHEGPADFYCTIERMLSDVDYWFEAGDATTAQTPRHVTVVTPPSVVEAAVRVIAPAYTQPRPPSESELGADGVQAVIGSTLTVSVVASKPIGIDELDRPTARLEFDKAPPVPLLLAASESNRLSGTFELSQDETLRIALTDADGFSNNTLPGFDLRAVADQPPRITVVEPTAVTEVTQQGSVRLVARAEDDFGIRQVRLLGEVLHQTQRFEVSLGADLTIGSSGADATAEVRHDWELASLSLNPGDIVVYRVEVTDNYAYQGATGQATKSAPLRLRVVDANDLENRLRDELTLLEGRVRQSLFDQESMRDELSGLANLLGAGAETAAESAKGLAQRQLRLAERLRRLAERFERVRERVRINRVFDEQTLRQVSDITDQLEQTASGRMTEAARAIDRLASEQADDIAAANTAQVAAADELRIVLLRMGRWGDFQESVAKARDLLDRQQQTRAAALRHSRVIAGKPIESLTGEQEARLRRIVREQRQLARELEQWRDRNQELAARLKPRDPPSAEALSAALRTAAAHRVLARMEQASDALADNRTAGAAIEQRAAETGLAEMLAALEARQIRELVELRKSVERAVDAVAELLRQQEELLDATAEANRLGSDDVAFAALADQQHALRRNTEQLGEELGDAPPTEPAARELRRATEPMDRAEQELRKTSGEPAKTEQTAAVNQLQAALDELERLAANTDDELLRKSLAQTRRRIEKLRERQEQVNTASHELVEQAKEQQQLSRIAARRATRLSRNQDELRQEATAIRTELEKSAVYVWVLDRVVGKMIASTEALTTRRLDDTLVERQNEIVRELNRLIDAIASVEALPPPDQFVDGGGGGGGAATQNQPMVPPVAELIVIKDMQMSLNERTTALHTATAKSEPTEADLRRARAIGEEQKELRALTEQLTRRAREGN